MIGFRSMQSPALITTTDRGIVIAGLPGTRTGDGDNGVDDTPERFARINASNRQHPDHDTPDDWQW
jgi:hypothetical protein